MLLLIIIMIVIIRRKKLQRRKIVYAYIIYELNEQRPMKIDRSWHAMSCHVRTILYIISYYLQSVTKKSGSKKSLEVSKSE
jgi:hypothetical protein